MVGTKEVIDNIDRIAIDIVVLDPKVDIRKNERNYDSNVQV